MIELNSKLFDGVDKFLLGNVLGEGISRVTFECKINPDWVIKVEKNDETYLDADAFGGIRETMFQNVCEWLVWESVQYDKKLSKYFSPCHHISACGRFMIQSKVIQPVPVKRLPKRLPECIGDLKRSNFGLLDDRVVACDYGRTVVNLVGIAGDNVTYRNIDWQREIDSYG